MTEQYLVLFDADHIKDYVFATGRLKEIRGASEQVRRLTDEAALLRSAHLKRFGLKRWSPGTHEGVIYASGGAGALLFESESRALEFRDSIERTYRRETGAATLTAVVEPVRYTAGMPPKQVEYEAQTRAAQQLAQKKASRPYAEAIPGGGFLRFCASDRLRPATYYFKESEANEFSLLSRASYTKRDLSRQLVARPEQQPYRQMFLNHCPETDHAAWRWAASGDKDLNAIGVQSHPQGYIAFVHVDGDKIGDTLRRMVEADGFVGYQHFSDTLAYAATTATVEALRIAYPKPPDQPDAGLPFEVITIGGDDVILVCTGEQGLTIATAIAARFGEIVRERLGDINLNVTASAGVVVAHASHPIVNLQARAAELLRQAKRSRRNNYTGVDFHIVSTPGLEPIGTIRKQQYSFAGHTYSYLARPYSQADMQTVLEHARILRKLPGRKRHALYQACVQSNDEIAATLAVLRVQMQIGSDHKKILQALQALRVNVRYPFLIDKDGHAITPLIDLLEAAEFVKEEHL